ncbi:KN motif and ankyrin repeat domain-containing protein 1-like isoform X2 [Acanthaster planci]|uniref:KN motif and ankyrin repeat domain-containing protein 1-like isoform X2 n=1 Tax=Acanthaster planci TaxID=133434 RepID=A0A8B7Z3G3_ACAPL|nr:KN motif and ankyrin repeat domain-containing protein 1-like isoform X2 [Acanthaster planci]
MAEGSSGRGVADGSSGVERDHPVQEGQLKSSFKSENRNASNNNLVEDSTTKRCSCCPYGYHIDLDFLNYCQDISSGANLQKIKKVKRSRPRHEAVKSIKPPPPIVPPRSVSVAQHKKWKQQREKLEADKILEKENAAFVATYSQFANLIRRRYMSEGLDFPDDTDGRDHIPMDTQSLPAFPLDVSLSDVETESVSSCSNIPPATDRRRSHPTEHPLDDQDMSRDNYLGIPHHLLATNLLRMSSQSGSNSSISSTSSTNFSHSSASAQNAYGQGAAPSPLLGQAFFSGLDGSQASGRSTPSSISTTALAGVRQQMAAALARLKQLEEQVKAIPVLQVKISVLKEEKRLLMLQLRAKNKKPDSRSVAVGDGLVECNKVTSNGFETEMGSSEDFNTDDLGINQPQISAVSALQRLGKSKPDPGAKKAIVNPVQRYPVATRSVGIDANFVISETKSVGINVTSESSSDSLETSRHANGWNGQPMQDRVMSETSIQVGSVPQVQSTPAPLRDHESYDNVQGKATAQEQYKRAMMSPRVNSLPNLSFSPPPVAPKPRARTIGVNTDTKESREKSTMVLPQTKSQQTSTIYVTQVEQGVATERNVTNQGVGTDKAVLFERTTNTDKVISKDQSTSIEPVVSYCRDRGCNTDIIQMRISATNTGPLMLKKPSQSIASNTDAVEFASQKTVKDSGTNPEFLPVCSQSTNTEGMERVDFGTGTHIMVQDSSTSTPSPQLREQGVGVDLQLQVQTMDHFTLTESVAVNDCTTNTDKTEMTSQGVSCITETLDSFTSTVPSEVSDGSTNTDKVAQSHRGVNCLPHTTESYTTTVTAEVSDGTTNTERLDTLSRGVDCIVETCEKSVDALDLSVDSGEQSVRCVPEEIVVQSVNNNLMAAMPTLKLETADKSLTAMITAETAECGTEMTVTQLVDHGTVYEPSAFTSECGTVTDHLGLDMGMNTDRQELTSIGCNTPTPPTVSDAGVEVNLMEKIVQPKVSSVSTSIDLDDISVSVGVGSCSVYDSICDHCTNLVTSSVAVGPTDSTLLTRTIGTNYSVMTKTIGVGHSQVVDPSASSDKAVGDHDIREPMCNICDRPPMKTVSTEKTGPETCDHAVGDAVVTSQVTAGVGDCTVTDRICEHCDNMTVSSVGVGNSEISLYTKTQEVQVDGARFIPIEPPLTHLTTKPSQAQPHQRSSSEIQDILASRAEEAHSVFLPQVRSPYQGSTSSSEEVSELMIQREFVDSEKSPPTDGLQAVPSSVNSREAGNNNLPKMDYTRASGKFEEWHRQEDHMTSSVATATHALREQTIYPASITTTKTSQSTSTVRLRTETGMTHGLDFEDDDDFMTEGFANLHALLAGASPQSREGSTMVDDSIREREDQHGQEGKDPSLRHRVVSSSEDSSDSESDTSTESSESATTSTSVEGGSYDGQVVKLIKKRQEKKRKKNSTGQAKSLDRPRYTLSADVTKACNTLGKLLEMSGDSNAKDMSTCMATVAKEWFRVTSQKTSDPLQVEDLLASLAEMGKAVLEKIVNTADANGNTALHYAISHGNFNIVDLLLESQVCDVDRANRAGYTAIMLASLASMQSQKQQQTLAKLFQLGSVNIRATQAGQTALMLAVSHGRLDMVKLLLDSGADVNIQDEDGSTALMCASEHGHQEIVKCLLAHPQCDPTLLDNDGSSAFSIAMEAGHKNIGVLLYAQLNFAKQSGSPKRRAQSASPSLSQTAISPGPVSPSPSPSPSLSSLSPCPSPSLSTASSLSDLSHQSGASQASTRSRSVSPNSRIPKFRHFPQTRPSQLSTSSSALHRSSASASDKSPSPRGSLSSLRSSGRGSKIKSPSAGLRGTSATAGSQRTSSIGNKQQASPTKKVGALKTAKSLDKFSTM